MEPFFFLFFIAFVWVLFAVVQDLKTQEIANWLTFSLIAFVLAFRAIYSAVNQDITFFWWGVAGICVFIALGYFFYYTGVFAGGDAKLLFGIGGIFPYFSWYDVLHYALIFNAVLFIGGIIYSLGYSVFLIKQNTKKFSKLFLSEIKRLWFIIVLPLIAGLLIYYFLNDYDFRFAGFCIVLLPLLYVYAHSFEKSCMIVKVSPASLAEGDWLYRPVSVKGFKIKPSVHGLSYEDITFLRKNNKKVWIKKGIPFSPAFLIALIATAFLFFGNFKFF